MFKKLLLMIISISYLLSISLQEAYDEANSYQEYDKYLSLKCQHCDAEVILPCDVEMEEDEYAV